MDVDVDADLDSGVARRHGRMSDEEEKDYQDVGIFTEQPTNNQ